MKLAEGLEALRNNTIQNYIVPGLKSSLIGGEKFGKVRLFEAERPTDEFITPHSHRFDFTCLVLVGQVINTLYTACGATRSPNALPWTASSVDQVCGEDGLRDYVHRRSHEPTWWERHDYYYGPGNVYGMKTNEIHSIKFSKGAKVLFFEGPELTKTGIMLEPWVDGKLVPSFKTEEWMFQKA
jgi:hypothetical protein